MRSAILTAWAAELDHAKNDRLHDGAKEAISTASVAADAGATFLADFKRLASPARLRTQPVRGRRNDLPRSPIAQIQLRCLVRWKLPAVDGG